MVSKSSVRCIFLVVDINVLYHCHCLWTGAVRLHERTLQIFHTKKKTKKLDFPLQELKNIFIILQTS